MKKYIQKHHDELIIPRDAFITFANEESYHRAAKLEVVSCCGNIEVPHFWNHKAIDFKMTKEPTNILYKNLYQEKLPQFFRKICFFIIICLFLMLTSFCLFMT